jgi:hypothetical protein
LKAALKTEGDRLRAPNIIELSFDYETYSRLGAPQRHHLTHELESSITEFLHNRRYVTSAPVRVDLGFDAFRRRLEVRTRFSESAALASPPARRSARATIVKLRTIGSRPSTKSECQAVLDDSRRTLGLGRSRDNALVVDDASVSNFHAAFTLTPDGSIWISDLGSSNGTVIDQVVLTGNDRGQVRDGGRLRFGDVEVTVLLSHSEETKS